MGGSQSDVALKGGVALEGRGFQWGCGLKGAGPRGLKEKI